ncbi:hypothetical protein HN014_14320 [Aquimarina sp. TRL1]|uniref:hypothetical protein n=1 Tax=Aquimarina sp. (strain TRL1) TaxID=2736252 RepID=UPI0015884826|nr:hypothetical protein [Aquimarina sp. TRL1]QKX06030.1 hypothetical protein HN014_14320 [Aquimarina sp. TRL1]
MFRLIIRCILPITIISFGVLTQWWYGIVIDGTDTFFYGFPFIYKCRAFHTSMATQYFILEMSIDLGIYFVFWGTICYCINRLRPIRIPRLASQLFWIGFGIFLLAFMYVSKAFNDVYIFKRNFEIKIIDTGGAIFENRPKREYYTYELEKQFQNNTIRNRPSSD